MLFLGRFAKVAFFFFNLFFFWFLWCSFQIFGSSFWWIPNQWKLAAPTERPPTCSSSDNLPQQGESVPSMTSSASQNQNGEHPMLFLGLYKKTGQPSTVGWVVVFIHKKERSTLGFDMFWPTFTYADLTTLVFPFPKAFALSVPGWRDLYPLPTERHHLPKLWKEIQQKTTSEKHWTLGMWLQQMFISPKNVGISGVCPKSERKKTKATQHPPTIQPLPQLPTKATTDSDCRLWWQRRRSRGHLAEESVEIESVRVILCTWWSWYSMVFPLVFGGGELTDLTQKTLLECSASCPFHSHILLWLLVEQHRETLTCFHCPFARLDCCTSVPFTLTQHLLLPHKSQKNSSRTFKLRTPPSTLFNSARLAPVQHAEVHEGADGAAVGRMLHHLSIRGSHELWPQHTKIRWSNQVTGVAFEKGYELISSKLYFSHSKKDSFFWDPGQEIGIQHLIRLRWVNFSPPLGPPENAGGRASCFSLRGVLCLPCSWRL